MDNFINNWIIFSFIIIGIFVLIIILYCCFYTKLSLTSMYKGCKNKIVSQKQGIYIDIDKNYRTFNNITNSD